MGQRTLLMHHSEKSRRVCILILLLSSVSIYDGNQLDVIIHLGHMCTYTGTMRYRLDAHNSFCINIPD